jgi:F0F1-type ATP synthase delta subunit
MLIFSLIVLQVVIFVVLITVFRNIMNKNVVSATKHLESVSMDYSEKEKEITKRIEYSQQKSQEIILAAHEDAEKVKKESMSEVEKERDKILQLARQQAENIIQQADKSRQVLLSEISERISKEAVVKACELVQHALPEQFKQDVHSQWINELIAGGFNQLDNLRMPADVKQVRIVGAFPLTEEQRVVLFKKLTEILGPEVKLKEAVDKKLVAGLSIEMGELVLDGSLRNKIQEGAKGI